MALRVACITLTVEAAGAIWTFREPDKALARAVERSRQDPAMQQAVAQAQAQGGVIDDADLPPGVLEWLVDVFVEGICGWEGVEGPDGTPLSFNSASVRAIPTEAKLEAATAYLQSRAELGKEPRPSAAPPTDCTPPAGG